MAHNCTAVCTRDWPATSRSHCSGCGENFSTVRNFDAHRVNDQCKFPEEVGLGLNERGIWIKPDTEGFHERFK